MLLFMLVILSGIFEWKRICAGVSFFRLFIYIYSCYQDGRIWIPLTALTPPHFYACLKPGPGFPTSYVVVFLSVQ